MNELDHLSPIKRDMKERWTPTAEQDKAAAECLIKWRTDDSKATVYTAHMLIHKSPGVWTPEPRIVPIGGTTNVYATRNEAFAAIDAALDVYRRHQPDTQVSAAYVTHSLPKPGDEPRSEGGRTWLTMWAVFEY